MKQIIDEHKDFHPFLKEVDPLTNLKLETLVNGEFEKMAPKSVGLKLCDMEIEEVLQNSYECNKSNHKICLAGNQSNERIMKDNGNKCIIPLIKMMEDGTINYYYKFSTSAANNYTLLFPLEEEASDEKEKNKMEEWKILANKS